MQAPRTVTCALMRPGSTDESWARTAAPQQIQLRQIKRGNRFRHSRRRKVQKEEQESLESGRQKMKKRGEKRRRKWFRLMSDQKKKNKVSG